MKAKSFRFPHFPFVLIALSAVFALTSCGVIGANNNYSVSFSPSGIAFGNVSVGTVASQNASVSNPGSNPVTIAAAKITGSDFSIQGLAVPLTLNPGASAPFTVTFSPKAAGPATGNIALTSTLSTQASASLGISGTGTSSTPAGAPAQIALSPATVAFGSISAGATATQYVTVSNSGGSTLTVSQVAVTGNSFAETGPVTPFTIAAGQSQILAINFAPPSAGSYSGSLGVSSDAGNTVGPVALSGTATVPATLTLSASPTSISFGSVTVGNSSTLSATLTNTGNSTVTVFSGSATGAGFSIASPTFPVTINAGATQQVSISFAPQASGAVTGSASFVSNASNSPTTVSLSGTGAVAQQHSVALSWNASTSAVSGYRIYRGAQSGGPYSVLNSTLNAGLTYTDSSVQSGQTYYYVVTAVDSSGNESVYSNQATAVIP